MVIRKQEQNATKKKKKQKSYRSSSPWLIESITLRTKIIFKIFHCCLRTEIKHAQKKKNTQWKKYNSTLPASRSSCSSSSSTTSRRSADDRRPRCQMSLMFFCTSMSTRQIGQCLFVTSHWSTQSLWNKCMHGRRLKKKINKPSLSTELPSD